MVRRRTYLWGRGHLRLKVNQRRRHYLQHSLDVIAVKVQAAKGQNALAVGIVTTSYLMSSLATVWILRKCAMKQMPGSLRESTDGVEENEKFEILHAPLKLILVE